MAQPLAKPPPTLTSTSTSTSTSASTSTSEKETVRVVIQARPLLPFEIADNAKEAITIQQSPPTIQVQKKSSQTPPAIFKAFDAVYNANPGETPTTLYKAHVKPLLTTIFTGVNATIFAYGQTSAGKSYTMKHLTATIANQLFATKRQLEANENTNITIRVSFVEIYRETIRDLVDGAAAPLGTVQVTLRERQTKTGKTVFLDGAKDRCVSSETELLEIVREGALVRRTAATGMNASSSRSHSIITISVIREDIPSTSHPNQPNQPTCRAAKLHLVDLAGSERAKRTAAGGDRFAEGVQINKGLFALAKVISTLADNSDKPRGKQAHVPYRDSKLTRLLQDSLGGNSRTLLIACVSPADSSREETLGTLRYAERARRIHNKPTVNRDATALEVSDLRAALARAKAEIAALAAGDTEYLRGARSQIASLTTDNKALREAHANCRCQPTGTDWREEGGEDDGCESSDVTDTPPMRKAGAGRTDRALGRAPVRADVRSTGRRPLSVLQKRGQGDRGARLVEGVRGMTRVAGRDADGRSGLGGRFKSVSVMRGGRVMEEVSVADDCSSGSEGLGEEGVCEEEEEEEEDMIGRDVRTARQESREEQMRKTFKERLEECENDKSQIDMERTRLLRQMRQLEETHAKQLEQVALSNSSKIQTMRSKILEVKKLEAETIRISKQKQESEQVVRSLQTRLRMTDRLRDEMESRLIENASREEVLKKTLMKKMNEIAKNERMLRQQASRETETRQKLQCVVSRLRAENESMRSRLRHSTRSHVHTHNSVVRRVNSSAYSTTTPSSTAANVRHNKSAF